MEFRREDKDGVLICYISGEVNINTVPGLKVTFIEIINEKPDKVLLNMEEVDYIDSLGLATLLFLLRGIESAGGQLLMSNVRPKVGSIFKITKIDTVLTMFDTEEEAVKNFR